MLQLFVGWRSDSISMVDSTWKSFAIPNIAARGQCQFEMGFLTKKACLGGIVQRFSKSLRMARNSFNI